MICRCDNRHCRKAAMNATLALYWAAFLAAFSSASGKFEECVFGSNELVILIVLKIMLQARGLQTFLEIGADEREVI